MSYIIICCFLNNHVNGQFCLYNTGNEDKGKYCDNVVA